MAEIANAAAQGVADQDSAAARVAELIERRTARDVRAAADRAVREDAERGRGLAGGPVGAATIAESLGGRVCFRSRVDDIVISRAALSGLVLQDGTRIDTDTAIFAPGHSARDLFTVLATRGVDIESKAFALGLRVEHPQELISRNQYGEKWQHPALGPAEYRLAARSQDGRGVYSFCMCPGGTVVNASSEEGYLACNGMSRYLRDGRNANAALVVSASPEDFESKDPLAGIAFQRRWEALAYAAAQGALPVQRYGDWKESRSGSAPFGFLPDCTGPWASADLNTCLPAFATRGIAEGMAVFARQINGYDAPDVLFTGVETRTSSPLRILRDLRGESSLKGLYVAGEGPGYAGGIMSAAMDGLAVARSLLDGSGEKSVC